MCVMTRLLPVGCNALHHSTHKFRRLHVLNSTKGRHPEVGTTFSQPRKETLPPELVDVRYARSDESSILSLQARKAFARALACGEASISLAEAALHVCAEDDALISNSAVAFPVDSYLNRIQAMVDELALVRLPDLARTSTATASTAASVSAGSGGVVTIEATVAAVEKYLLQEKGFRLIPRSTLPERSLVDHPGVWEDLRGCYLDQVLIRRAGPPEALAIILGEVWRRLAAAGTVDFAVTIDYRDQPYSCPIPGRLTNPSRAAALNTVSTAALRALLRRLKRGYWPFSWDTSLDQDLDRGGGLYGGFRPAAKIALGDEMDAMLAAISKVAGWRLQRGIFTSAGAGDMRRALAAAERLVMMEELSSEEEVVSHERRDLAVLLMLDGQLSRARAELSAYVTGQAFRTAADLFDRALVQRMSQRLEELDLPPAQCISVSSVLGAQLAPEEPGAPLPLTW